MFFNVVVNIRLKVSFICFWDAAHHNNDDKIKILNALIWESQDLLNNPRNTYVQTYVSSGTIFSKLHVHLDIRHRTKWRMDLQESQTRSICTYIRLPWAGVVPIIAVIYTLVSIVLWQYLCRRHSSRQCALICRTFFHFLKWKVACWRDKNACCCACAYVTSPSVDRRWAHHHKSGKLPTIMLLSSRQSHIISQ